MNEREKLGEGNLYKDMIRLDALESVKEELEELDPDGTQGAPQDEIVERLTELGVRDASNLDQAIGELHRRLDSTDNPSGS